MDSSMWKATGPARRVVLSALAALALHAAAAVAPAADAPPDRIRELEESLRELAGKVRALTEEIDRLKADQAAGEERAADRDVRVGRVEETVEAIRGAPALDASSWVNRFQLGGYGEVHANFREDHAPDVLDFHRFVLYLGYDFSEWIRFHSEIELEHAFVSDGSGGEVGLEQAYVDFLLSDALNFRVGRILTPLGIINKKHEPPMFNGVERPGFDRFIIPTTWSSDGLGVFGNLSPSVSYEAYIVGGLDGSKFNALNGIRGGRIKETASLNEPAFTARLDYYPFAERPVEGAQTLRLGVSTYVGGLDNGNSGRDPGVDGDIRIFSGDFEYTCGKFDFRGVIAHEAIDGAREIGKGTASEMVGGYIEVGYHFWPDAFKDGRLEKSDAVAFVRYDRFDTQHRMPSGVAGNPAGERQELTLGVNFYLTPSFVIKADYQFRDDGTSEDLGNLFNFGIGWTF